MNANEKRIYNQLTGRSNSMELLPGGQVSNSAGVDATISQIVGNPAFKAEISLQIFVRYYSQAVVGTPVAVVPPAGQQTNLPLYLFGTADYQGNYARVRQLVPGGAGWQYADMSIIPIGNNAGQTFVYPLPHAAAAVGYTAGSQFFNLTLPGDLLFVIPMTGFVAGAAATTVFAEILVRCPNVPYLSLLNSLMADNMTLNMIRYVVPAANTAQFANQLTLVKNSLFGKSSTDTLDPQTFITPGTFQPQIADIPITLPIDKFLTVATTILYTAVVPMTFTLTLTVSNVGKNVTT
jgi:hypothetical protein